MRWLIVPVLLATAAGSAGSVGSIGAQTSARPSADSAALVRLEDGWTQALVRRDGAFFNRTLAPGFIYTEDDRLMTREQVIRDATTGSDTVTTSRNIGMVVHLFGATGVVTGVLEIQGRSGGKPFTHRYRFTDTWVREGSGWRIVAAQDYLIPVKGR
jgi:hypothetical protein